MPPTLTSLLSAIPTAENGQVITPQYHNTLRAAVTRLAEQLGSLAGEESNATITFSPMFFPVFESGVRNPEWVAGVGFASRASGQEDADGWFALQLPHQARINRLTVIGRKTGAAPMSFRVWMYRSTLADPNNIQMINLSLRSTVSDLFQVSGDVTIAGVDPRVIEEYRKVDNSAYQYFIQAKLIGADAGADIVLFAFQVAYSTTGLIR